MTCLLQCFVFDKFEPYETEEDLVVASLKYTEDQKLWAGTVYLHFRVVWYLFCSTTAFVWFGVVM